MGKPTEDWASVLAEAKVRLGGRQRGLRLAGMSETNASRAFGQGRSFQVLRCLRLADRTGLDPSRVLRAAGKIEEADLIERLYGLAPQRQELDAPDPLRDRMLAQWLTFDSDERRIIEAFLTLHESRLEGPPRLAPLFSEQQWHLGDPDRRKQKQPEADRNVPPPGPEVSDVR